MNLMEPPTTLLRGEITVAARLVMMRLHKTHELISIDSWFRTYFLHHDLTIAIHDHGLMPEEIDPSLGGTHS